MIYCSDIKYSYNYKEKKIKAYSHNFALESLYEIV